MAGDSEDDDADFRLSQAELNAAAEYRLARSLHVQEPGIDATVAAYVAQSADLLAGRPAVLERGVTRMWRFTDSTRARGLAEDGLAAYPYARRAGDLLLAAMRAEVAARNPAGTALFLNRLWLWLPDYDRVPEAFSLALAGAAAVQNFSAKVDLQANDPRNLVVFDGSENNRAVIRLCEFLMAYGDREVIAPQATLMLARARLLRNQDDDLSIARQTYDDFLIRYPEHSQVFDVLTEQALSWLVTYRGDHYDQGALRSASLIIDQAEIQARGNPEQLALVSTYRSKIRGWHQQRDLTVARWYRARGETPWTAPLTLPVGLRSWLEASRYYYRETIFRDPGSDIARIAQQELNELPLVQTFAVSQSATMATPR